MPRFAYRAKDQTLHVVEGTIEAESETAAISRLGHQGVFPVWLIEVSAPAAAPRLGRRVRVGQRTLATTTHQLADLLGGGLPLLSALTLLARQTEHHALRQIIDHLAASVRDGQALSEALAGHPRVFPPLYRSMVKAGETGGALEQALRRLAELGEHEAELKSRVVSAAAYPLFVLGVAVAMTAFLLAYVIPKLSLVFLETNQLLPLPTRVLLGISRFVVEGWWLAGLGLLAALWGLRRWYASASGRLLVDRLLITLPVAGSLVRKLEVARLTRTLGTLVGQGVPILQALDVVAANAANATLRLAIRAVRDAVQEGATLASSLSETSQFPAFVSNMVAVGEESGTVDAALLKVASTYERDADRILRTLTTIVEPVLLVGVGGVVMFIVLAMLLPVFQIGLGVQ